MRTRATVPRVLPLAPGWWDAAPGSPPAHALHLAVTPREGARSDDPLPDTTPAAVAHAAALGVLELAVPGPLDAARQAAARLGEAQRRPAPLTDADAAARGGVVRVVRDGPGWAARSLWPGAEWGADGDARARALWRALARWLVVWSPAESPPPGWARRSVASAWLDTASAAAQAAEVEEAFSRWARAAAALAALVASALGAGPKGPDAAGARELLAALASLWTALSFIWDGPHADPSARAQATLALRAGARAVLLDDDGRLALALREEPGDGLDERLRAAGVLPWKPRPTGNGLRVWSDGRGAKGVGAAPPE